MKPQLKLPLQLILPARAEIGQGELLAELQITRMTLLNYRKKESFPEPIRKVKKSKFYQTADVAAWLRINGCTPRIV